nr:putative ribonuclease H-like domain-containing protein [Tanacetum cinerariifolium]
MAGEDTSQPPQPPIASPEVPQMVSSVKPHILKKDEAGNEIKVPPVTAQQILARTRERKAKSTLLMAISDEHLARFHGIKDAKTLWATVKTRFGEGLDKGYDRFLRLLNMLEIYGAVFLLLHAIVLRHKVAKLSMRVKRYYKKTRRKLEFNGKKPIGFDKTKVECYNCHIRRHFARDCRSARNSRNMSRDAGNAGYRGRDNGKRPSKEEDKNALVVQDGLGTYEWSYQVEEEVTDFTLMAFTSNPSISSSSNSEENSLANDRFKKGEGYHAVPPPLTGNYMPPKPDLSFVGLDDSIYKFKISETVTSLALDDKDAPKTSTASVEKPKEDRIPVNAAKPKATASTSAAKPVNTTEPKQSVNFLKSRTKRVNTAGSEAVSDVKGNGVTAVKTSAVTDDFSRFSWEFFLASKDETSKVLKPFIIAIENQINKKVKVIRCDNRTEFKNRDLDEFCGMKRIKREYSHAKTLQQNRVIERKNRTLIEAARTMLADSLLPITFWAEAVNTAFSVGNQTNKNACPQDTNGNTGTQDNVDLGKEVSDQHYIVLPLWSSISSTFRSLDDIAIDDKPTDDTGLKTIEEPVNEEDQAYRDKHDRLMRQAKEASDTTDALREEFCSTNSFNTDSHPVNSASTSGTFSATGPSSPHLDAFIPANTLLHVDQDDSQIPNLGDTTEL